MSDLGDLLELIHTAHRRARTVRAVLVQRSDGDLRLQSARRWQEINPRNAVSVITATDRSAGATPRIEEKTYRVWRDSAGDAWRVEVHGRPGGTTILNGPRWWHSQTLRDRTGPGWAAFAYDAGDFITNVLPDGTLDSRIGGSVPDRLIELMLDPASLPASLVLQPMGRSEQAGRPAVDALARWRKGIELLSIDWPYADELRLSVDAEYGVLLRLEFVLEGQTFIELRIDEIAFDELLPASLFEGPPATPGQGRLPDLPGPGRARRTAQDEGTDRL